MTFSSAGISIPQRSFDRSPGPIFDAQPPPRAVDQRPTDDDDVHRYYCARQHVVSVQGDGLERCRRTVAGRGSACRPRRQRTLRLHRAGILSSTSRWRTGRVPTIRQPRFPPAPAMTPSPDSDIERPPLLRSWRRWYAMTIGVLVILVVLFRLLTVYFR